MPHCARYRGVRQSMSYSISTRRSACLTFALTALVATSAPIADEVTRLPSEALAGGTTMTVADTGKDAYLHYAAVLDQRQLKLVAEGRQFFETKWAFYWFEQGLWGRGPTSNAESCAACHANKGRGAPPAGNEPAMSMIVRLSLPGEGAHGAPKPLPDYGDQLQTFGIPRFIPPEGQVHVRWREQEIALADGEVVVLRMPDVSISDLSYGALGEGVMTSARVAPPLVGVGLLDAVADETILALAARQALAGIRGHPNYVWDVTAQRRVLGRFGLKANHPNLRQQIAAAFIGDIGLSTSLFPEQNCPGVQQACREMMFAGKPEITDYRLETVDAYVRFAAVPAWRNADDPEVKRGEQLFAQARCAVCHVPELTTSVGAPLAAMAQLTIHPYTDLLLHDMGEALADHRPDFEAGGRDWRTAPLWGSGLSATVNGNANLLHDGRARNVTEAILWHGGEATVSRDAFREMPAQDRAALVQFVQSL
jgi:CxxC motif-containing protein (DUF1111 family)